MEMEVEEMKVLGAVVGGGKTIKNIKETSRLDKKEIEKILERTFLTLFYIYSKDASLQ